MHEPRQPTKSAAALLAPLAQFIAGEDRLGHWAEWRRATAFLYEFTRFGVKQGWACLFGGAMVALIVGTHMWYPRGVALARCWRLFDFRFTHHPPLWAVFALGAAIYVNFYAHHYTIDIRYLLFGRTWVYYRVWHAYRRMPLLLGLFLVALFVWIAENLGMLTKTWLYPHQMAGWSAVSFGKLGSWFLLLLISYALVAAVNRPAPMTVPKH